MWQGELCDEVEATLLIKTSEALIPALQAEILALHPYDVPEILALAPTHVLDDYARWALDALKP